LDVASIYLITDSGLSLLLHEELHWLDVIDHVRYKLVMRYINVRFTYLLTFPASLLEHTSTVKPHHILRRPAHLHTKCNKCYKNKPILRTVSSYAFFSAMNPFVSLSDRPTNDCT